MDVGYPRPLSIWSNVEDVADGVAYQGTTYFFQEQSFQVFSDRHFQGSQVLPLTVWFGCPAQNIEENDATTEMSSPDEDGATEVTEEMCGGGNRLTNHLLVALFMALIVTVVTL